MKPNSLLLESISEEALAILQQHTSVHVAASPKSGMDIATKMPIKVIVTRGAGKVDEELVKNCQGLQMIARCGVGLDNVAINTASQLGVKVLNAPGSNANTVAEHTLALILALQRQIYTSATAVKNNNWNARLDYTGNEIRGKTLGILGLGNIGKKVAKLATAFGMTIQYCNRSPQEVPYKRVDFEELLASSDIISLHLPIVPDTQHLMNAAAFQTMKPSSLLINTARGGIIEERALFQALKNQTIGGFAADVLAQEPPALDNPLLSLSNTLITPHTASLTATTFNQMCVGTVQNVVDLLTGKAIDERCVFNREEL